MTQERPRGGRPTVAVCVATYQRPRGLHALLRSLDDLKFSPERNVDVHVVVVDNDPMGVVAAHGSDLQEMVRWPLEVLHEPRRGIPFARNAAVRHALSDADHLAFVDDDEVVSPDWLDRLLDGVERYRAAIATGPVLPLYPDGIPTWMIRGRFFDRDRFPTGTRRPVAYTGNVLVSRAVFADLDHHFDESLALTGGSDKELFTRAAEQGHSIVWIDEAEVLERVAPSRATLRWLMRRRYTRANLAANELRRQHGSASRQNLRQLVSAIYRVMGGPLRALVALREGPHVAASRLRDLALNLGRLTGSLGLPAEEYRRVHGDPGGGLPSADRTGLSGPVFIMPFDATSQRRPVAGLLGAAALTLAARGRYGHAWLLGPDGWLDPREIRAASWSAAQSGPRSGIASRLPLLLKTALKDARRLVRVAQLNRSLSSLPLPVSDLTYVWQRHELGFSAGERLARRAGAPFVVSVHAAQVREGEQWGVRRPVWGPLLERLGEQRILHRADLVTCVSDEVAGDVRNLGVPPDRLVVVPNGVDTDLFAPDHGRERTRDELEIRDDDFVVGWAGSFHRFHGLDILLEALAHLDRGDLVLLLVGSGHDLARVRRRASELGIAARTRFTGAVPNVEVPRHLNAMDVGVLTTAVDHHYHYSPLKLREYMACSRPVIAPGIGEPARLLTDGQDALLVRPGDPTDLASAIMRMLTDDDLRMGLGRRGRERAVAEWSWEAMLARIEEAVATRGPDQVAAAQIQA